MANTNSLKLAKEWFEKGKADLDFAKIGFRETKHYGEVCFLCQQSTEKYLKGFLVANKVNPRKIHSIATLIKDCSKVKSEIKKFIPQAKTLDRYYIPTRYPVLSAQEYKKADAEKSLKIAESITLFVKKLVL